ncbi:bifunctional metallophosphatase/5'-nucleotidase [Metabacillus idriensis]|uniref:bifunctional metallophosphatase/5'-nucleotidase n=1 Tax=Metabacillus idriensis TaxID=324768 RepID=UPI00174D095D|nr:bifunctional UDP-sugar hydrolase/5'-nucleotidase [Metabacillus idriensis]
MAETIHLYHTNDLHSYFENWPKVAHYLNRMKKEHAVNGEDMILVDVGDHIDRVHPITEATHGKANVELLNALNYDAVTIGNNEGITLPHAALDTLYTHARFPVILSNLYTELGERPSWVKPYEIMTLSDGTKAVLLGVSVFYEKFYHLLGWKIKDPFQSLKETIEMVKGEADIIILLSHLGINDDEIVAKEFPEIDVILGAHTHHIFENGKLLHGALLTGAGKNCGLVGHISLTVDKSRNLIAKEAEVINILSEPDCEETKQFLINEAIKSDEILSETVAVLEKDLSLDWFGESEFPDILASALKEWCNGEVSMVNAGMLLEPLKKGPVTKKSLHRICPHPINPCTVYLKGDVLKEVILEARTERMEQLKLKGLGFRGHVMGRMVFDGIEVLTEPLEDGLHHVKEILVSGAPIQPERIYAVATVDMFTLGVLYPSIGHAEKKTYYMPEMLRDLLAWKLKQRHSSKNA